jgi:hypothetical protein
LILILLLIEILLDDTRGKEVFFYIEVTVVSDEYLFQLTDFGLVVITEGVSIAQPFHNIIASLTSNEKNLVGLPLEGLDCLQEIYDVAKIFLEVFSKEPIHYIKYSYLSLIIELNIKVLRNFPFFLFFLVGNFLPSGIDVF